MPAASGEASAASAKATCGFRRRGDVPAHIWRGQECGELLHAGAGDPAQHGVIGGCQASRMAATFAVSSPLMRSARCSSRSNTSHTQEIVVCVW